MGLLARLGEVKDRGYAEVEVYSYGTKECMGLKAWLGYIEDLLKGKCTYNIGWKESN